MRGGESDECWAAMISFLEFLRGHIGFRGTVARDPKIQADSRNVESVTESNSSSIFYTEAPTGNPKFKLLQDKTEIHSDKVAEDLVIGVAVDEEDVVPLMSKLQQDVARLKVDKLELLRQNVAVQRELKR